MLIKFILKFVIITQLFTSAIKADAVDKNIDSELIFKSDFEITTGMFQNGDITLSTDIVGNLVMPSKDAVFNLLRSIFFRNPKTKEFTATEYKNYKSLLDQWLFKGYVNLLDFYFLSLFPHLQNSFALNPLVNMNTLSTSFYLEGKNIEIPYFDFNFDLNYPSIDRDDMDAYSFSSFFPSNSLYRTKIINYSLLSGENIDNTSNMLTSAKISSLLLKVLILRHALNDLKSRFHKMDFRIYKITLKYFRLSMQNLLYGLSELETSNQKYLESQAAQLSPYELQKKAEDKILFYHQITTLLDDPHGTLEEDALSYLFDEYKYLIEPIKPTFSLNPIKNFSKAFIWFIQKTRRLNNRQFVQALSHIDFNKKCDLLFHQRSL